MDLAEERLREMGEPLDRTGASERLQGQKEELLTRLDKAGQDVDEAKRALDLVLERQRKREEAEARND